MCGRVTKTWPMSETVHVRRKYIDTPDKWVWEVTKKAQWKSHIGDGKFRMNFNMGLVGGLGVVIERNRNYKGLLNT